MSDDEPVTWGEVMDWSIQHRKRLPQIAKVIADHYAGLDERPDIDDWLDEYIEKQAFIDAVDDWAARP
jgi:hypothetical protein